METINEDVFYSNACEILRKRIPDPILRDRLAIEVIMDYEKEYTDTSVYHGWNKNYHGIKNAKTLLEKSPFFFKYINDIID